MNLRISCLWAAAFIPAAIGQSARGPIEGVWRAVEVTHGPAPGVTIKPGPNLAILTARHYSRVDVQTEKPGRS